MKSQDKGHRYPSCLVFSQLVVGTVAVLLQIIMAGQLFQSDIPAKRWVEILYWLKTASQSTKSHIN